MTPHKRSDRPKCSLKNEYSEQDSALHCATPVHTEAESFSRELCSLAGTTGEYLDFRALKMLQCSRILHILGIQYVRNRAFGYNNVGRDLHCRATLGSDGGGNSLHKKFRKAPHSILSASEGNNHLFKASTILGIIISLVCDTPHASKVL